jgi:hypothetical protein
MSDDKSVTKKEVDVIVLLLSLLEIIETHSHYGSRVAASLP